MKTNEERMHEILGQNIAFRRKALGLSQSQFVERAGITISGLKDIERGVAEGRIETRLAIAQVLNCDLNELYRDPKAPSESKRYSFQDAADFLSKVADKPQRHQSAILALVYGNPYLAQGMSSKAHHLLQALLKAL